MSVHQQHYKIVMNIIAGDVDGFKNALKYSDVMHHGLATACLRIANKNGCEIAATVSEKYYYTWKNTTMVGTAQSAEIDFMLWLRVFDRVTFNRLLAEFDSGYFLPSTGIW